MKAFIVSIAIFGIFWVLADYATSYALPVDPWGFIEIYPYANLRSPILIIGGLFGVISYFLLRKCEVKT